MALDCHSKAVGTLKSLGHSHDKAVGRLGPRKPAFSYNRSVAEERIDLLTPRLVGTAPGSDAPSLPTLRFFLPTPQLFPEAAEPPHQTHPRRDVGGLRLVCPPL